MSRLEAFDAASLHATAASIANVQEPSGAVPWFPGGHVDPWDHVECAMALTVAGFLDEARAAFDFLRRTQRADGSWPAKVTAGVVEDASFETNQCAYVAVGVWHHLVVTGDENFAEAMWPTVRDALDLVTSHATERGEISWSVGADGRARDEALLTGSSSTYHALRCGLAIADRLDAPQPEWEIATGRLGHVIAEHPEAFLDKARFSMDWYYPVLAGIVRGAAGRDRLRSRWDDFVISGLGIRCVDDEPWVTGAETAELVIALDVVGMTDRATEVFLDIQHLRTGDGSYWTGWQFANNVNWPAEHSTWTAAAVILAADALLGFTPGNAVFVGDDLPVGLGLGEPACGCATPDTAAVRR
ncbi:MAG TPA: prenyltransferase [Mycobacteriales bacterium]|nr:prenyltransferase [Mycobacteriales bacterium]